MCIPNFGLTVLPRPLAGRGNFCGAGACGRGNDDDRGMGYSGPPSTVSVSLRLKTADEVLLMTEKPPHLTLSWCDGFGARTRNTQRCEFRSHPV